MIVRTLHIWPKSFQSYRTRISPLPVYDQRHQRDKFTHTRIYIQIKQVREIFSRTLDKQHIGRTNNKCTTIGYLDATNWRQMQADAFQPPYPAKSRQGSTNAINPVIIPWSKKPSELPEPCPVGLSGMRICSRTLWTI